MTNYNVDISGDHNDLHVFQNSSGATVSETGLLSDGQSVNLGIMQNNINELDSSVNALELQINGVFDNAKLKADLQTVLANIRSVVPGTDNISVGYFRKNILETVHDGSNNADNRYDIRSMGKSIVGMAYWNAYSMGLIGDPYTKVSAILQSDDSDKIVIPAGDFDISQVNLDPSAATTQDVSNELLICHLLTEANGMGYRNADLVVGGSNWYTKTGVNLDYDVSMNTTAYFNAILADKLLTSPLGTNSYGTGHSMLAVLLRNTYNNQKSTSLTVEGVLNKLVFEPLGIADGVKFYLKDTPDDGKLNGTNSVDLSTGVITANVDSILSFRTYAEQAGNGIAARNADLLKLFAVVAHNGVNPETNVRVFKSTAVENFLNYNCFGDDLFEQFKETFKYAPQNRIKTVAANPNDSDPTTQFYQRGDILYFDSGMAKWYKNNRSTIAVFHGTNDLPGARGWSGLMGGQFTFWPTREYGVVVNVGHHLLTLADGQTIKPGVFITTVSKFNLTDSDGVATNTSVQQLIMSTFAKHV